MVFAVGAEMHGEHYEFFVVAFCAYMLGWFICMGLDVWLWWELKRLKKEIKAFEVSKNKSV